MFVGLFHDDRMQSGVLTSAGGACVYEGTFKRGLCHGQGTLKNDDWTYAGAYKRGLMHGKGTYRFKSGNEYKGHFRAGKRDGSGTRRNAQGTVVWSGVYRDGRRYSYLKLESKSPATSTAAAIATSTPARA